MNRERLPPRPTVEITEEDLDDRTQLLVLRGELDANTAPAFKHRLDESLGRGKTAVLVDMADLTFIDSIGLMVLIEGLRALHERSGEMALVNASPRVLRPFGIAGLESMFKFFPDRQGALAHLAAARANA